MMRTETLTYPARTRPTKVVATGWSGLRDHRCGRYCGRCRGGDRWLRPPCRARTSPSGRIRHPSQTHYRHCDESSWGETKQVRETTKEGLIGDSSLHKKGINNKERTNSAEVEKI